MSQVRAVKCLNIDFIIESSNLCLVNPQYCFSPGPILANANTPTPQTSLGATTTFTCNNGYASSGGAVSTFYTCKSSSSIEGSWSSVTFACVSTMFLNHIITSGAFISSCNYLNALDRRLHNCPMRSQQ